MTMINREDVRGRHNGNGLIVCCECMNKDPDRYWGDDLTEDCLILADEIENEAGEKLYFCDVCNTQL